MSYKTIKTSIYSALLLHGPSVYPNILTIAISLLHYLVSPIVCKCWYKLWHRSIQILIRLCESLKKTAKLLHKWKRDTAANDDLEASDKTKFNTWL
jgi:hypothetical protein